MKRFLALVLSLMLLCTVTLGLAEVAPAVKEAAMAYFTNFSAERMMISAAKLFEKIDAGEDMLLLDVRQPDAYAEGHLKGAVNVPFGPDVAANLSKLPDDVQIYVNCYSGQTSSQVVALLNVAGKFATNIQSGFNNGISKAEGFEKYIDTAESKLDEAADYAVDPDIQAAIAKYFDDMAANAGTAFASNNFKPESLKEVLDAELEDYFVYSVRKAEDFAAGHIQGAVNNPFGTGMEKNFEQLPTDKKIIVYCYSGQTASQVTAILRLLGYDAYNLAGGMGAEGGSGWLGGGNAVVTE
ncbi:MAG: rhodanese-like domain-containing protein [Clostridia bacterium]